MASDWQCLLRLFLCCFHLSRSSWILTLAAAQNQDNEVFNVLLLIPALLGQPASTTLPIDLSPDLPHIKMPVGHDAQWMGLLCAVDSCAGVNLGHFPFHERIQQLYPELVVSFQTWKESTTADRINIGGVEQGQHGIQITHIVTYRTPYRDNGQTAAMSFGLSQRVAATVILGVTFLRKSRGVIDFNEPPTLMCNPFQESFAVTYQLPSC